MPALPWVSVRDLDPEHDYVVMATRFVVRHRWHLLGVMNSTQQLWQSLPATAGLAGYAFSVSPLRGSLCTLTAWHDRSALTSFVRSPVHASLVARTGPLMKSSRFTEWMSAGADLPPTWKDAHDTLGASRVTGSRDWA
jgi:quinol monooxygenase YgiN